MTNRKPMMSIASISLAAAAFLVLSTNVVANESGSTYRYAKLPSITPFEKHCVSTSQPGSELLSCLDSQPKSDFFKLELNRSRSRLNLLDEIAYDINVSEEKKTPWETFCDNTTSEASLCLYYCYDGIPCPYD